MSYFFLLLFVFSAIFPPAVSFGGALRTRAKSDLINLVTSGAPEDRVLSAVRSVERLSFGGATLASPLLPGNWLMVWTTSGSIAGRNRIPILQTRTPPEQLIDVENGRVVNAETVLGVRNAVEASIMPASKNKVNVQFERFRIGPLAFAAPESLKGTLSVSYLDEDMRVSRGDQGNVFVLLRESNERKAADAAWDGWRTSWPDE
mmetsp:Transcript_27348/g.54728  ORF Transcript_27348/g.54728 Transcript_27348/m.54728 type:complete len:204 (+) Transcript_27348:52-663(+)